MCAIIIASLRIDNNHDTPKSSHLFTNDIAASIMIFFIRIMYLKVMIGGKTVIESIGKFPN
jgi:hypothetical protein